MATPEQRTNDFKIIVILGLFITIMGSCFYIMSGAECVRQLPDGTVRCECDFKDSDAWDAYKDQIKGGYEAVSLDNEPCK